GRDVPHLPPRPLGRAAGGRLRRAQGRAEGLRAPRASRRALAAEEGRGLASLPHGGELVPLAQSRAGRGGARGVRRTGPVLAGMLASVGMVAPSPGHVAATG